jgi:hypothetical protein
MPGAQASRPDLRHIWSDDGINGAAEIALSLYQDVGQRCASGIDQMGPMGPSKPARRLASWAGVLLFVMFRHEAGCSTGSANAGRTTLAPLTVQHQVRDYAALRPGFDAHEPSRVGAGITNGRVYRKAEDPNDLVLLFDVADVAKARAWTQGEDLKAVMQKVGVISAPVIHFFD